MMNCFEQFLILGETYDEIIDESFGARVLVGTVVDSEGTTLIGI